MTRWTSILLVLLVSSVCFADKHKPDQTTQKKVVPDQVKPTCIQPDQVKGMDIEVFAVRNAHGRLLFFRVGKGNCLAHIGRIVTGRYLSEAQLPTDHPPVTSCPIRFHRQRPCLFNCPQLCRWSSCNNLWFPAVLPLRCFKSWKTVWTSSRGTTQTRCCVVPHFLLLQSNVD